jgi:hypothetical protein
MSPTALPTKAPTSAVSCLEGTTYWLYDPTTNKPVRKLINNTATCLPHPYNIEVRPCNSTPPSRPVQIRLVEASTSGGGGGIARVVHKGKAQLQPPFFLLAGPASTKGARSKALRNGMYSIAAAGAPEWGRLTFTQICPPCRKGRKGCMMKRG